MVPAYGVSLLYLQQNNAKRSNDLIVKDPHLLRQELQPHADLRVSSAAQSLAQNTLKIAMNVIGRRLTSQQEDVAHPDSPAGPATS